MQLCAGAQGDGGSHLPALQCVQPPHGGLPSPVAHVLSVELLRIGKGQAVFCHGDTHPGEIRRGQMGKAVLAHCQQAGTQKVGLLFVKALLGLQKLADDVVQNHRRMGQSGVVPGAEGRDIIPVLVQPDGVGIGQHRRIPDLSAGIVADVHGRTGRQHRRPLSLTGVQRRRGLGIAEGVHDAMVAYPVAGAEILVSGVVEHAPAEAAHMAAVGRGVALHLRVAQRLRLPVAPGVIGLGRVHVTGMLGDQQRLFPALHNGTPGLAAGIVSGVGEVVVGVDVLQQVALF